MAECILAVAECLLMVFINFLAMTAAQLYKTQFNNVASVRRRQVT